MFFKRRAEMGDGGVSQHNGNLGYAETFFVQQIARMFHPLALVEIKNGGAEEFFKSLFEVTLVDGHFAAEFADGKGFADMLQQDLPGQGNFLPVILIRQELALKPAHLVLPQHAFQAVEQEHLGLGIDENILEAVSITMIQYGFQHHPDAAAEG